MVGTKVRNYPQAFFWKVAKCKTFDKYAYFGEEDAKVRNCLQLPCMRFLEKIGKIHTLLARTTAFLGSMFSRKHREDLVIRVYVVCPEEKSATDPKALEFLGAPKEHLVVLDPLHRPFSWNTSPQTSLM